MPDVYLQGLHGADYTSLGCPRPPQLVMNLLGDQLHSPSVRGYGEIGYLGI